jgi:hypothetical protein
MFSNILKLLKTNYGKNIVSIILGFGLASLFRNICENEDCIEFHTPNMEDINKTNYKYNDVCYHFTKKHTSCDVKKNIIKIKNNIT